MNLKIIKQTNILNITFDNISLIYAILIQSHVSYFAKTHISIYDEFQLYINDIMKNSKNFEKYHALNVELGEGIKNHGALKNYLTPISQLSRLDVVFDEKYLETFINILSGWNHFEAKEILKNLLGELTKFGYFLDINTKYLQNAQKLKNFIVESYGDEANEEEIGLYQGIESKEKVTIIFEGDFDNQIVTSMLYKNLDTDGLSFEECIDRVENMDNSDKDLLFRLALGERKKGDYLGVDSINSSIMIDLTIDVKTYLELSKEVDFTGILQKSIPLLGYDYPDFIEMDQDEKEKFDNILTQITIFGKENGAESEISFYNGTLAHLVRTTFELNPIHFVEFLEKDFENISIQDIQREIYKEFKKLSPIFARYIKI